MAIAALSPGDRVLTHGLVSEAGKVWNGAEGIINSPLDQQTGRYEVRFQAPKYTRKAFKPENLKLSFHPGDKVIAHSLRSELGKVLNGADGVVESLDKETERYQVVFETHGSKALRVENLRLRKIGGPGAAAATSSRSGASAAGGAPAAAARWSSAHPPGSIAEACEAAAQGATSGETVHDSDIRVLDPSESQIEPEVFTTFDQCVQFPIEVVTELKKAGFPGPSQIQAYAWPLALKGKDVIGIAATGSGKTLAFLLPSFCVFFQSGHDPKEQGSGLLVMSPTRELAQQIHAEANRFGKCIGISAVSMYGGAPKWEQVQAYKQGVHAIIACPGRLNDCLEGGQVRVDTCRMLVLDEADRMLDMGFEPQITKILARMRSDRHTMFFTATWPREVRQLASTMLRQPYRVMIGNREDLKANQDVTQQVRVVEQSGKIQALQEVLVEAGLVTADAIGKALVFVGTKKMCEEISVGLTRAGVQSASIHGDKDQWQRDQALAGFKHGYCRVLVATDVAARGLDIKGVGLVVNYDIPNNTEDYVHRIGRTGRAGAKGFAITLITRAEGWKASGIIKIMEGANQDVPADIRSLCSKNGGGGGGGGGGGKGGGGRGSCAWCAKGECWTHGPKKKGRSRSPRRS